MARKAKPVEEVKKPTNELRYENIGNIPYDFDGLDFKQIELKAQFPTRLNRGDIRSIPTGIKIKVPENAFVLISGNYSLLSKDHIAMLGGPYVVGPEEDMKEVHITLSNFSVLPKIIDIGAVVGYMTLIYFNRPANVDQKNKTEEISEEN